MPLHSISEFAPSGMQIASPGGFCLDPAEVVGIEAHGQYRDDRKLVIHLKSGKAVTITFHGNSTNDAAPDHYGLMRNIQAAMPRAAKPDGIALQNAEFEAARRVADALRAHDMTGVVDDDYPEVRHKYDNAMRSLIDALRANGRL